MKKRVGAYAIELVLPENIYICLVFNINLLKPITINLRQADYIQLLLPLIKVNSENKLKVTTIIDSCYFGHAKKLQYQVQ